MTFNEEWEKKIFSKAIDINPSIPFEKNKKIKHVGMADLEENNRKIQRFEIREYNGGSKFSNRDTLMAKITPCLENGKSAYVDILNEGEIASGSTEFIVMRAKPGVTDSKYIYYLCTTPKIRNIAIKSMTGTSGRQRVQTDIFDKIQIKLPSLNQQKKIAKILSTFDKKIEVNNKINNILKKMAQAIYKSWFIDFEPFKDKEFVESELGMIPKGWKVGTINDFVNVQNGYGFSSKLFFDKGDIGVVKIGNITEKNTVNISDTQYISEETAKDTNDRYLIKPNSILIAMTGAKVGKIGIVPNTNTTLYLNQRVGMLKPKINGGIEYSYIALMTDYYQNVIKNKAGGSGQANISATAIGSIKVIIPSKKVLDKYADIIKPILNKISSNLNQNQTLKGLRDSLLPKLMSGEIRIPLEDEYQ